MNRSLFNEVLNDSSATYKDTLATSLSNIEDRFNVNLNLHDVAGVGNVNPILETIFISRQYHNNAFCNHLKKNKCSFKRCVENKGKLCNHCRKVKVPFYGACYMGVDEFVYPVFCEDKLIAIICAGQFCDNKELSKKKIENSSLIYGLDSSSTLELFFSIIKEINFDARSMVEDIAVLSDLIVLTFKNSLSENNLMKRKSLDENFYTHKNSFIMNNTLKFINDNYDKDLSLKLIALNSFCNHTYLSHLFKEKMNICVTDYINKIRIQKSKELLDITSWSITEISSSVGFNDSGYFTRVFKSIEGIPPKDYRDKKTKNNPYII